jgi:hypothetical protein
MSFQLWNTQVMKNILLRMMKLLLVLLHRCNDRVRTLILVTNGYINASIQRFGMFIFVLHFDYLNVVFISKRRWRSKVCHCVNPCAIVLFIILSMTIGILTVCLTQRKQSRMFLFDPVL